MKPMLFTLLMMLTTKLFAQDYCVVTAVSDGKSLNCTDSSSTFDFYHDEFNLSDSFHFRPDIRPTVIKVIKLNFIIVQHSLASPQNFVPGGLGCFGRTTEEFFDSMMIQLNGIFSTVQSPSDIVPGYSG